VIPVKKIVIWGHKLESKDTFSFVHYGLERAARCMGFPTMWLDEKDNLSGIDLSSALFISEGKCWKIPVRKDCWYIIFNYNSSVNNLSDAFADGRALVYQCWNGRGCEAYEKLEKLGEMTYLDQKGKTLHLPWATDRLPPEIEEMKTRLSEPLIRRCAFVGSMNWSGPPFDMDKQWNPFIAAAEKNKVPFVHGRDRRFGHMGKTVAHEVSIPDPEEAVKFVFSSLLAPAVQGHWQCEVGHLADRIFKNLSCGKMGITNNPYVNKVLGEHCVFCEDTEKLFYMAMEALPSWTEERAKAAMDLISKKYTYINRIAFMLSALEAVAK
jgi:hypothetical protein